MTISFDALIDKAVTIHTTVSDKDPITGTVLEVDENHIILNWKPSRGSSVTKAYIPWANVIIVSIDADQSQ